MTKYVDMNTRVTEIGNEAIYELGLSKVDPEWFI